MNDPSVTQQADNWCASCKTPFAEGEKVRQLPHCEHFVHEHCCPVEAGRCSIDAQLLDLSNLANHQPFPFSEPEYSRYDRLVDNMFQSHNCRNIAWIHSQLQNYEEAVRWLRRALRKKPDNPNAMMDLAECYQYGHGVARNTAKATQLREEAQPIIDQLNRQNATFLQLNPRTTPDTTADENTLQSHSSSIEKQEQNGGKKSCENIHASTDSENEPTFTRSVNDGCHSLDESSCRQVHGNVLNNTTGIAPRLEDTHVDPLPSDSFENENNSPQSAGKSRTIVEQQTSIGINTVPSDQRPAETVLGPIEQSTEQAAQFQGDDDSDQEPTHIPSDNTVMPGAEAEVWERSQDATDSENEPTFTRSVNDGCHSLDESSCRQVHGNVLNNTTGIAPRLGDTHVDPLPSDSFENENNSPQSAGKSRTIVEQQTSIGINTVPSDQRPAETVLGPIEQSTEQAAQFQGDDDSDQEPTHIPSDNTVMPGAEAEVWERSQDATDSENEPTFTRSVNDGCHSLDESSCRQVHGNVLNNTTGIAPRLGDTHVDPLPSDSFENENNSPQSAGKSRTIVEQQTSIGINTVPSDQRPAETVLGPIEQSTEQAAQFQGDDDSDQEPTHIPSDNTVMPGAEAEVWERSQDDASQETPETPEEEDESSSDIDIGPIRMFPSFSNSNRSSSSRTSSMSRETYSITGWGLRNKLYRWMSNGCR